MNTVALLHPRVVDRELLRDFSRNLMDHIPGIERSIARLKKTPDDRALIASLFRALHNLKGDASVCQVEAGVMILHPVETLLARLRDSEIEFTDLLAEVVLLAMDRLELTVEALENNRPIEPLKLVDLVKGLEKISRMFGASLNEQLIFLIEAVTGSRPAQTMATKPADDVAKATKHSDKIEADLAFFRRLTLQFEARQPHFEGRNQRLRQLVLDTNEIAGGAVDPVQLEAAVYMHDVGMMFLPERVWLKTGQLSAEDKQLMRDHPLLAAGLLERMAGWQEAAQMVAQHHEMPDGAGYPQQLKGDEICAGAKILAIADAFESVMIKHRERGQSRSILRAIAEVNACDKQFAPEWIAPFNMVIRRMVESGH